LRSAADRDQHGGSERLAPAWRAPPLGTEGATATILRLQATAGNRAVGRLLARQPQQLPMPWELGPKDPPLSLPDPDEFVFLIGAEENVFNLAKSYYSVVRSELTQRVLYARRDFEPSLDGVLHYLSQLKYPLRQITIVVHGNLDGTLFMALNKADKDQKITPDELRDAVKGGALTKLSDGQITHDTRINIKACNVGHNQQVVELLDEAFGAGAGTVRAAKVKVGYSGDALPREGLTGWWIATHEKLTTEQLVAMLKDKYPTARDRLGEMRHTSGPKAGQSMSDDEKWFELARTATVKVQQFEGRTTYYYVAQSLLGLSPESYESDPTLTATSSYKYSPEEI
jgi:hypothetical protein